MATGKPIFSIVLPAYNAEQTISNCLEGIINQTITDWILLIVDDGSTDRTGNILDRYASQDSRIKVFHRTNHGVSASRNYAISKINTPYFVCVDSDDYIFPNYLEELLNAKIKYPEYFHIWSCFQTVEQQKQPVGKKHLISETEKYSLLDRQDILRLFELWMVQMPWHRLYNTKIVQQNNLKMDETLSLGEDLIFNLQYLDAVEDTRILIINETTYNYVRNDKDSLDHKYRHDLLQIYSKIDGIFEQYLNKWGIEDLDTFVNSCYFHYENILKNTFHRDNKESFIKKIKFNNKILKSDKYRAINKSRTCSINKLYDRAYQSENYFWVLCLDMLIKISRKGK